jgi:diguanylate cyclase
MADSVLVDDGRKKGAVAKAAQELAGLRRQGDEARAELSRLQREVTEAVDRLKRSEAPYLLEANEQLVLAALRAQIDTEFAAGTMKEMSRSVNFDSLTQLPNRVLLRDRLAQAIATARRQGTRLALLFLDLDNFKEVNDTLGHGVGDEVLKLAAHRLVSSVREADTVSRHGGDEFLILLGEVSQASDAIRIADKILAALGAPTRVGPHVLRLTASVGIVIYPDDGEDAGMLIDRADTAMYGAKRRGLRYLVFRSDESDEAPVIEPPALASMRKPLNDYELALLELERRQADLCEANERLVLAALDAQALQAAAERAQRQQMEFLAVLAHELRNPLAPIRAAAATLGLAQTDEAVLPRMQAVIERQVTHMSRLVEDLIDVSRVSTGKLQVERQRVDLVGIVDAAVDACRPAMDTRLQRFSIDIPSRAIDVDGDPVRLAQVVSNLLDNASKYTPQRGEIRLSVVVADDAIVLTVSDSGIGISAEALPHVFEPFVRDARAIGFNGVGLGIGLTVVHELVEAHGGTVVAASAGSGRGSRFVVTLPRPTIHPE